MRPFYTVAMAGLLFATPAAAQPVRAVDGDTLAIGTERVRVIGLDAPELHGQCPIEVALAREARDRMAALVGRGVRLFPQGRDRYGRLLAVVLDAQGRDVAAVMIGEGLARPYDGRGRRQGWCG